jgi:hypothetical protein
MFLGQVSECYSGKHCSQKEVTRHYASVNAKIFAFILFSIMNFTKNIKILSRNNGYGCVCDSCADSCEGSKNQSNGVVICHESDVGENVNHKEKDWN